MQCTYHTFWLPSHLVLHCRDRWIRYISWLYDRCAPTTQINAVHIVTLQSLYTIETDQSSAYCDCIVTVHYRDRWTRCILWLYSHCTLSRQMKAVHIVTVLSLYTIETDERGAYCDCIVTVHYRDRWTRCILWLYSHCTLSGQMNAVHIVTVLSLYTIEADERGAYCDCIVTVHSRDRWTRCILWLYCHCTLSRQMSVVHIVTVLSLYTLETDERGAYCDCIVTVHSRDRWTRCILWMYCHCTLSGQMNAVYIVTLQSLYTIETDERGAYCDLTVTVHYRNRWTRCILWPYSDWTLSRQMNAVHIVTLQSLYTVETDERGAYCDCIVTVHCRDRWTRRILWLYCHCTLSRQMNVVHIVTVLSLYTIETDERGAYCDCIVTVHYRDRWTRRILWLYCHCTLSRQMNAVHIVTVLSLYTIETDERGAYCDCIVTVHHRNRWTRRILWPYSHCTLSRQMNAVHIVTVLSLYTIETDERGAYCDCIVTVHYRDRWTRRILWLYCHCTPSRQMNVVHIVTVLSLYTIETDERGANCDCIVTVHHRDRWTRCILWLYCHCTLSRQMNAAHIVTLQSLYTIETDERGAYCDCIVTVHYRDR